MTRITMSIMRNISDTIQDKKSKIKSTKHQHLVQVVIRPILKKLLLLDNYVGCKIFVTSAENGVRDHNKNLWLNFNCCGNHPDQVSVLLDV